MIRAPRHVCRQWLVPLILGLMLLVSAPALAQQAAAPTSATASIPAPLPAWQRTLYKTITYQAVSNAADLVLFDLLIGGGALATAGFFAANAVTTAALYYGFEYTWQTFGPPLDETTGRTLLEKTILYRGVNSSRIFVLGYVFGGGVGVATAFVAADFVTDTAVFVSNEYVWDILRPQQAP
ncbi:MAG: DUF2061 domain-containing protein [Alphaproteobacteria bacterium]|nr:DUF2061 domain-containing protein [Alphaproteobacteria bacterium]